jgi:formylglycine-generating enzyme required for sulfatase activity
MSMPSRSAKEIFLQALELVTIAAREEYLDTQCGSDADLRREVEELLRHQGNVGAFLESPPTAVAESSVQLRTLAPPVASLEFLSPTSRGDSLGRLGHYEILEIVGSGGMGIVLKAFDERLQRIVAIKAMNPALAASGTGRQRFVREAQAAAAVNHDNVVDIYAVEEAGLVPYLVMEYIAGISLEQKLKQQGCLAVKEILRIGLQTADGLAAAHRQGLVHRDVKPANILLENGVERVKITDFGLARAADDVSVTQTGVIAGTPAYMSPEQARGEGVDHRSDLFSLGSVLYSLCTGEAPFRCSTSLGMLKQVCEEAPHPIRDLNAEIPDWLCAVVDKLHAKLPAERFQSAAELAETLGRYLAHLQQPAIPFPTTMPLTAGPEKLSLASIGSRWRVARRRWMIAAVAALMIAGVTLSLTDASGITHLAATVIRIFTPDGTLVVETDDPGVKVTIEGDGGLVIAGAGPQEVRVLPGNYQVQATKDGKPVKVDHELVTISRGGRQVVRVSLESRVIPAAHPETRYGAWTSLFNEKDLTGWQTEEAPPQWVVHDKTLVSGGPPGYLFSNRSDYRDFHLRAQVRINSGGNSGILIRTTANSGSECPGYEAQICADVTGQIKTGSIFKGLQWQPVQTFDRTPVPAGSWFDLEVIARGPTIVVKVNDAITAEYSDPEFTHKSGRIALQHYTKHTRAEFRKIEIREEEGSPAIVPFDAVTAKALQEACAERLGVPVEFENFIGMKLRLIPPGEFMMGTPKDTIKQLVESAGALAAEHELVAVAEEGEPRRVRLTNPIYLGQFEVTRGQFRQFVNATGYQTQVERSNLGGWSNYGGKWVRRPEHVWSKPGEWQASDDEPVCHVTWHDAEAFCQWLGKAEGREYALPSEAQWEFASRAGTTGLTYARYGETRGSTAWTNELIGPYDPARHSPQPGGRKLPNAFGLYDMLGNVWEPCSDWYAPGPEQPDLRIDPTGPAQGTLRVIRGGAWYRSGRIFARTGGRQYTTSDASDAGIGFRVAIVGDLSPIAARVKSTIATPQLVTERDAFVLLGANGVAERRFATLAEAVKVAGDGDTIEIRGDGPFLTNTVEIRRPLTIRAGKGFRPVLKRNPLDEEKQALLTTNSALVVEGLELQDLDNNPQRQRKRAFLESFGAPLLAANCRFVSAWATNMANGSPRVELRNCEVLCSWNMAAMMAWVDPPSQGKLRVQNCVSPNWGAFLMPSQSDLNDIEIEFLGNSFAQHLLLSCFSGGELWNDGTKPRPFRVKAENNVLRTRSIFRIEMNKYRTDLASWPLNRVEGLANSILDWQGEHNLYLPTSGYELWSHTEGTQRFGQTERSRAEWRKVWGAKDANGLEGDIRFQGGPLQQRVLATPYLITPPDFRLAADSAGKGAGRDGKDLGADVDLIGPGAAYERWQRTTDYHQWLQETQQMTTAEAARRDPNVASREIAKWQGEWEHADYGRLVVRGNRYSLRSVEGPEVICTIQVLEVTDEASHVLLTHTEPDGKVRTAQAIVRLEGDTLHNCSTIGSIRPTEFKNKPGYLYTQWKRVIQQPTGAEAAKAEPEAAARELAKWQGQWEHADYGKLVIQGERWSSHPKNGLEVVSMIKIMEVADDMTHVVLLSGAVDGKVRTIQTILRVDGNTLHNCGTIGSVRPTEFANKPGFIYTLWKRVSSPSQ